MLLLKGLYLANDILPVMFTRAINAKIFNQNWGVSSLLKRKLGVKKVEAPWYITIKMWDKTIKLCNVFSKL